MSNATKIVEARAFLRGLSLLLKSVRLYGIEHGRTSTQLSTAWDALRSLLAGSDSGFLLGISGSQLLLDGVPLEVGPAERSFAELLSAAGLASIQFSPRVTPEDFRAFVRAFAASSAKAANLVQQLKSALGSAEDSPIRVNEVRFVVEDPTQEKTSVAAQLAAQALGGDAGQFREWLNDPGKLLQLLTAAQAREGGSPAGSGTGAGGGPSVGVPAGVGAGGSGAGGTGVGGTGFSGSATGSAQTQGACSGAGQGFGGSRAVGGAAGAAAGTGFGPETGVGAGAGSGSGFGRSAEFGTGSGPIREQDLMEIFRVVTHIAKSQQGDEATETPPVTQVVAQMPSSAQNLLQRALAGLAAMAPAARPDAPMLLQLAEHLAIRFALERYERGEVRVNAVRQLIERISGELGSLRKVLAAHEEKMARAGILVESHADLLDRQFWASVPDSGKRAVLLSPEAWCIPPRNVRQFVEKILDEGQSETAASVLTNYAASVGNPDKDARRKAAVGISELATLYVQTAGRLLDLAMQCVSEQLGRETQPELQQLLAATFVRLEQEAANRRHFTSVNTAIDCLEKVAREQPTVAAALRPRIAVENRLPEFVEEALAAPRTPEGFAALLRRMPRAAAQHLAARFGRCERRQECNRVMDLFRELGAEGVAHLSAMLHAGPVAEAASSIGLLSRYEPRTLEQILPVRLATWNRFYHDIAVRQIACAAAPERGRLLAKIFTLLDSLVLPEALDELSMSNDPAAAASLLQRLAVGEMPQSAEPFMRVKAMEALGRLRIADAALLLRGVAETKKMFRWAHPEEMRLVATQAMEKIDPEWASSFIPRSGLPLPDLRVKPLDPEPNAPWTRQRRYVRMQLPQNVTAVATTARGECCLSTSLLSLGGGLALADTNLTPGTPAKVKLQSGLRGVRAEVLVRGAFRQHVGFEIVQMDLEERSKLRHLLAGLSAPPAPAA